MLHEVLHGGNEGQLVSQVSMRAHDHGWLQNPRTGCGVLGELWAMTLFLITVPGFGWVGRGLGRILAKEKEKETPEGVNSFLTMCSLMVTMLKAPSW